MKREKQQNNKMDIDIDALPGPTEEQLKALDPNEVNLEAGDWSCSC